MSLVAIYDDKVVSYIPTSGSVTLNCKANQMASNVQIVETDDIATGDVYYLEKRYSMEKFYTCQRVPHYLSGRLVIRELKDGIKVLAINDNACYNGNNQYNGITSVIIPNGITSIGDEAFYGCSGIKHIAIPATVTSIGAYAFKYCSGLTSIRFGGTVAQWNAIEKGYEWAINVPASVVACSDGSTNIKE